MDREMDALCERQPGPMDHVKIERKCTVMYSTTGVKVQVMKEGWLTKNSALFQSKRYFVLQDSALYMYKDEISGQEGDGEKISLRDAIVFETSSKNTTHTFTILSSVQQLTLSAASRKLMEEWFYALKLAICRSKQQAGSRKPSCLTGQHHWYDRSHSKPTYCNVCREALHGVAWHGLSCEVCKYKTHKRCAYMVKQACKWTTTTDLEHDGVPVQDDSRIPHQWLEGNLVVNSHCQVCSRPCGSLRRLQDYYCMWCKHTVHTECRKQYNGFCTLGELHSAILPPSVLQKSDSIRKGMWEPYKLTGGNPVLGLVNSRSGDNQGIKFLRRLKQILNPLQVFDLATAGPELGFHFFERFDKFRVLACGGDGTYGWVLSTIDKLGMHPQCYIGTVPLGTGNDLSRVLGWGSACDDDDKLFGILKEMENSAVQMLDRWSIQHEPCKKQQSVADTKPPLPELTEGKEITINSSSEISSQPDEDLTVDKKRFSNSSQDLQSVGEFGKSLSVQFSNLLYSDDDTVVISSARKLADQVQQFIGGLLVGQEERTDDPIVSQCYLLRDKLKSLASTLAEEADATTELPPKNQDNKITEKTFRPREALMARANSLKKALKGLIDQTESAVDLEEKVTNEVAILTQNVLNRSQQQPEQQQDSQQDQQQQKQPNPPVLLKQSSVGSSILSDQLFEGKEIAAMNNYCGIGLDAKISYEFHTRREENPGQYTSRAKNMVLMGYLGGKELLWNSQKSLSQRLTLEELTSYVQKFMENLLRLTKQNCLLYIDEYPTSADMCDGKRIRLPRRVQGVVVLNIGSYMAGTNFWGTDREKDGFSAPSIDDRLVEVVAVTGATHMATAKVLGIQNQRLAQCRSLKIIVAPGEKVPIQVDGEAWLQEPGVVSIVHKNRARMLAKNKDLALSLRSWQEQHKPPKERLFLKSRSRGMLFSNMSETILDCCMDLAGVTKHLFSLIQEEALTNVDVEKELLPQAFSSNRSMDRIFPHDQVSLDADVEHLEDFKRHTRALIQETHWFLKMKKVNAEVVDMMECALKHVEIQMGNLLLLMGDDPLSPEEQNAPRRRTNPEISPSVTSPAEAPAMHPRLASMPSLSATFPRERTAAINLSREAADTLSKLTAKEVACWSPVEVCNMLDSIGLSQYQEQFTKKNVDGKELLAMQKQDFIELGIDKAVHQIKLRQALKIIIGKRTSQPPCELSSSDHDTTAINTSTKMTFKIIPSDSDTIV